MFKNDSIITDSSILRCDLCDVVIAVDDKHQKTRGREHIESPKHIKSSSLKNTKNKQLFIRNVLEKAAMNETSSNEFFMDLAATFTQA